MILVHTGDDIVSASQPTIPVLDHGFLFGDSVYDVVRTAGGRPFMFEEHMARLRRSAAMIYFEFAWTDEDVAGRLLALRERLDVAECYFRIIATRGPGPISLLPDGCDRPQLYIIASELMAYPEEWYANGCRVAVVRRLRVDPRALDPKAKTGNYLNNMLGFIEARRQGADDALFMNADGHLTEATTSNLGIVEGGTAVTPPLAEGLLPGITREWVERALPQDDIPVEVAPIDPARLAAADEIFLSGTVKGIMPVAAVDGNAVGRRRPGPVTLKVAALYAAALARN